MAKDSSAAVAPPAGRRGLGVRVVLALASSAVALLVCEAGARARAWWRNRETLEQALARPFQLSDGDSATLGDIIRPVADDRIAYALRPGLAAVPFKGAPLSTDSHGFRSPEAEPGRQPGTVTLLGLGDSIQFGHGVGDGECYLDRLVELLRERRPEVRWRVVNTAVPGYNTVMEVETLERRGLAFAPDLIVLGVCGNDYEPPVYVRAADDVWDLSRSFFVEWVRERSSGESPLARYQREALSHRGQWSEAAHEEAPPRYAELYGPASFAAALDRLRALAERERFRVLAFATVDYAASPEMMDAARARGFAALHLQPVLERHVLESTGRRFSWAEYPTSDLVVAPSNLHPSVLQHELAARALVEELERLGWIDWAVERALDR